LNLGAHVGDDPVAVRENRRRLATTLQLPMEPVWLRQVHGNRVVAAGMGSREAEADASFTRERGVVCAVLTADCLPILLCTGDGSHVAAVHAGWRGLAGGVIEAAVGALETNDVVAWLGPAIGPDAFQVGDEVRQMFLALDGASISAFRPSPGGRWWADLYQLARLRFGRLGIDRVFGGHWCTYGDPERFFSHRRDGLTGRMATLIWRD
jgi:YfiH family protein